MRTSSQSSHRVVAMAVFALVLSCQSQAGLLGWFSSKPVTWERIQQTGGVKIGHPTLRDERLVLPLEHQATRMDSALTLRKTELKRRGSVLVLRIFTQLVEEGHDESRGYFADLTGIPSGGYLVYYESEGDFSRFLGKIEIK